MINDDWSTVNEGRRTAPIQSGGDRKPDSIGGDSLVINNSVGVSLTITPGFNPETGDGRTELL